MRFIHFKRRLIRIIQTLINVDKTLWWFQCINWAIFQNPRQSKLRRYSNPKLTNDQLLGNRTEQSLYLNWLEYTQRYSISSFGCGVRKTPQLRDYRVNLVCPRNLTFDGYQLFLSELMATPRTKHDEILLDSVVVLRLITDLHFQWRH